MGASCLILTVEQPSDMESAVSFFQMVQPFDLQVLEGGVLKVFASFYQSEDWESLHQQLTQELLIRSKAACVPLDAAVNINLSVAVLKNMSFGFHGFSDLIADAVLQGHDLLAQSIKRFVENAVGGELLRTVLSFIAADLNQSKAAKDLYMHRNTLLYRIDQFTQLCGIDPRRFEGAFAIQLLFR